MPAERANQLPVVIAGAGPAGLVAAVTLARNGVRSLLVERNPACRRCPGPRPSAPGPGAGSPWKIPTPGEQLTVLFEAPLADVVGDRRHGIYFIQHPEAGGVLVPNGTGNRWLYGRRWDPPGNGWRTTPTPASPT